MTCIVPGGEAKWCGEGGRASAPLSLIPNGGGDWIGYVGRIEERKDWNFLVAVCQEEGERERERSRSCISCQVLCGDERRAKSQSAHDQIECLFATAAAHFGSASSSSSHRRAIKAIRNTNGWRLAGRREEEEGKPPHPPYPCSIAEKWGDPFFLARPLKL